ncbi:MAG: cupin domain-containing protein [Desulfohalobiaceae bacterium]
MSEDEQRPVVLHEAECDEGWNNGRPGRVAWRTLFSSERTPTESLTAGVGEIGPGNRLKAHQHTPPEVYHVLAGEGTVLIREEEYHVKPGTAVFIPGNAVHGLRNTGPDTLRFLYVFAADSFDEVDYRF